MTFAEAWEAEPLLRVVGALVLLFAIEVIASFIEGR